MATQGAGAGRGKQGGPTAEQMAERNSPNYMTPETERQLRAERDERLEQAKANEAYNEASKSMGKKRGGKIAHHKTHAKKRDGIAKRGHTKGSMR